MYKIHLFLFLAIFFFCCTDKKDDVKIEIYFVKNKILSDEGILLKESRIYKEKQMDTSSFYFNRRNEKFDTITNQVIYGGKYKVSKSDLESEPFIKNNEILMLNKGSSEILLSDSGFSKLRNLKYKIDDGKQYVITVNKKPVLNGYLNSCFSSKVYSHNCLVFEEFGCHTLKPVENHPLKISCTDSYISWINGYNTDLKKYPELTKAFGKTKRLR